jgi:protein-tyrosine phosphatase
LGFDDLHSHVLPALDDGAPDLATGMAMLRGLEMIGFDRVSATPHQKASQFMPTREAIDAAYTSTKDALARAGSKLSLGLAAENYWDDVFFERTQDGSLPRYDGGRSFLFEIPPPEAPPRFEDGLFRLGVKGWLPVMAHPERYQSFWGDVDRLAHIGESVALVVDLGALAGYHGWKVGRVARALVKAGIIHAAASDVHTPDDVRVAAEGIAWIKKKLGPDAVTRLLDENPRRILAGELPDP